LARRPGSRRIPPPLAARLLDLQGHAGGGVRLMLPAMLVCLVLLDVLVLVLAAVFMIRDGME